ncbi:hypothetical protein ColLi_07154 [Colletotrichum liriopes]|uniref:Uncharacterized protein n=1 Tax=Colletotrichum liriopes TaxID=708192 RepID=A0AA37GPA7_9PEZI|nr:hypothetical protein ColLi_07154 [Colletotrichum liriopes]
MPPSPARRLEAEKTVEGVGDGRAAVARGLDLGLGVLALRLGGVVGTADVGELVADAVDDDVGVQGVLLALGDNRVGGKEGALVRLAARAAELEVDSGSAGTEVSGATGIASIGVVASVVVVVPGIVVVVVVAAGVKGARQRGGRVGVLGVGAGNGRVDEGHDAAEGLGGGERGVAADVGDAGGEGVEVLLGGDEALGGVEDVGAVAESGDLVGKLKLGAGVGGAEESAGDASGERGGFAGGAGLESGDGCYGGLLLAEAGFDGGQDGGEEEELGVRHVAERLGVLGVFWK